MRRTRKVVVKTGVLLGVLLICELSLRLSVTRHGHVERLFGKKNYYLVPFGVPESMPSIAITPGQYGVRDDRLGWQIAPLGKKEPLYYSNEYGHRCSKQEYETAAASTSLVVQQLDQDIVTIGDSFTHGDEVRFEDSWPHILATLTGRRTVNLGVGGYGIDQAFLRYEYSEQRAKTVILGLIAGDLERARTQVYSLERGGLKTKPMFVRSEGELRIVNQPTAHGAALQQEFVLGAESPFFQREPRFDPALFKRGVFDFLYLYRVPHSLRVCERRREPVGIYRTPGPSFEFSLQILRRGRGVVEQRGGRLVVVLMGNLNTFGDRTNHDDPWRLLRTRLQSEDFDLVDTSTQIYSKFLRDPDSVINAGKVHYTPAANRRVAELIAAAPAIRRSDQGED